MEVPIRKSGEFIALLRTEAGLTSIQFAELTGKDIPYLERYPQEIEVDDFIEIARALGLDPSETFQRFLAFNAEGEPS